jgi:hypothetical protein
MIAVGIGVEELLVGLNNTDYLNIGAIQESAGGHERSTSDGKLDMAVGQADDANFERSGGSGGNGVHVNSKKSHRHHQKKNRFHGVPLSSRQYPITRERSESFAGAG